MIPTTFHLSEIRVGDEFIFGATTAGIPYYNTA